jgi:hypothetical protein
MQGWGAERLTAPVRREYMKETPRDIGDSIRRLYIARNELRNAFPELAFTLDGKLIGDIGEAIAIADYGLIKLKEGSKLHDFKTADGRLVQVKTTQQHKAGTGVGLGLKKESFEHLIVIQLSEEGTYRILFDGPGRYVDEARRHRSSPSLTVSQLKKLNDKVNKNERVIQS